MNTLKGIMETIIRKYKCTRDGYKVLHNSNHKVPRCARMKPDEKRRRQKAAQKSARKRKPIMNMIIRKAQRTREKNARQHQVIITKELN